MQKCFIQDHVTRRMNAGGVNNCEQGASFPLGLTLELYRELLDSIVTWTMSCKQFSSDLQRAAWFMGGSSK